MLLTKSFVANSEAGAAQFKRVQDSRIAYKVQEQMFANAGHMVLNDGILPDTAYQMWDAQGNRIFRADQGDVILNDIMPLSTPVNIGTIIQRFPRFSDAGNSQTSLGGRTGFKLDAVDVKNDGTLIPIHDNSFGMDFRQEDSLKRVGMDLLNVSHEETNINLREKVVDGLFDGWRDDKNQVIVKDGLSWAGFRADSRVQQVDLGASGINFDFTDTTATWDQIEAAFKEYHNILWITNNCNMEITYYFSREALSNMQRTLTGDNPLQILSRLTSIDGVSAIKATSKLVGNQSLGMPLDKRVISPIVGMGFHTVTMPRPLYNSPHQFINWGAMGLQVRTDYNDVTCVVYASELS